MKNIVSLLLVYCFSCCIAFADGVHFYGAEKLASSLISCISQDSRGYIWIATEYGLSKFDGLDFKNYYADSEESNNLLVNNVTSLYEDRSQRFWIGTNVGIQYYDPDTDSFVTIPFADQKYPSVRDIIQLRTGEIIVATSGYGVYKFDAGTNKFSEYKIINDLMGGRSIINRIFEDSKGRLWISTVYKGLFVMERTSKGKWKKLSFQIPGITEISAVTEDKAGNIWVGAGGTLYLLPKGEQHFKCLPINGHGFSVRSFAVLQDGRVYVATYEQGVLCANAESETIHPMMYNLPWIHLPKTKVVSLFEDRDHNLWIGCFQSGILQIPYKSDAFIDWNNTENQVISTVYVDREGKVWGGIENSGLVQFDEEGNFAKHIRLQHSVISICQKNEDIYWVGTYGNGFAEVNVKTGDYSFLPYAQFLRIKSIVKDNEQKHLYVSAFGKGVLRFEVEKNGLKEEAFYREDDSLRLKNQWVNVLLPGKDDKLWIGHYQGVDCYDMRNRKLITLPGDSVLNSFVCYSLLEDKFGKIWIGTNKGLWKYDPQKKSFRSYTTKDGLSDMLICGLAEDKEGNIWCSTFKGINQIKLKEDRIINYYSLTGSSNKEYLRSVYAYNAQKDIIYFGNNTGLTVFEPSSLITEAYLHPVVLTKLFIGNSPVNIQTYSGRNKVVDSCLEEATSIRLAYEDNTFSLRFSTMDYVNPGSLYYEYRFVNIDSEWDRTFAGENRISFIHLDAGTYKLEVRACLNGSYSPVKTLTITIDPVWYLSGWAYCVYILLALVILYVAYCFVKRKRQEELSEEKLRFFINIAHELRSPMVLIISPLESLLKRKYDEETTKALRSMYRNSNRILSLLNQLLDIRRIDKGQLKMRFSKTDLVSFIDDLHQIFEFQAEKKHIRFLFEPEMKELPVWIDCNNFDKVLVNVISNAFKYTPEGGEIKILLREGHELKKVGALKDYAEIAVMDTGEGIDENKLERIFERFYQVSSTLHTNSLGFGIGLNLSRLLVELHHGTIVAMNRKDTQGSCFLIRIPLGCSHLKKEEIVESDEATTFALPQGTLLEQNISQESSLEKEEKKTLRAKTNYKVLVADDDEEVRNFIQSELGHIYKVLTAADGKEAMQLVLSEHPDLVISDVVMPEIDGCTLVKMLKNNSETCHIPVIMLTSKAEVEDRIQGIESGVDAYMAKPFVMQELESLIYTIINNHMKLKGKYLGLTGSDEVKLPEIKSNDTLLMERVMKVIQDNMANPEFTVEVLAEEVGLSRVQLHRKLKELTGVPASDLIRNTRLKQAAALLKENKMNISQVAYAVGYVNHTYFSTAFKKYYGMSPTDYVQHNN